MKVNLLILDENNLIYKIIKRHKFLENYLIEFKEINDTHIFLISENAKHINLNGCHRVTDNAITHIASKCPKLENLELYWMPHITDNSIKQIFENCPNINSLNLSGCKTLTYKSLSLIKKLKNLEEIVLNTNLGFDQMCWLNR
jgi:F-box/leucine-rich repeat protein 2/20